MHYFNDYKLINHSLLIFTRMTTSISSEAQKTWNGKSESSKCLVLIKKRKRKNDFRIKDFKNDKNHETWIKNNFVFCCMNHQICLIMVGMFTRKIIDLALIEAV